MSKVVTLKQQEQLVLDHQPFASGGEGDVYEILSPPNYKNKIVKLYKKGKRGIDQENKINFLVKNPPFDAGTIEQQSLVWMEDVVYENGVFAGYVMRKASGQKLEILCHYTKPETVHPEWRRFFEPNADSNTLRLKICFNVAVAVYQLHSNSSYVLVDLKPENIIIEPNGRISIVDLDSLSVVEGQKLRYPPAVTTPEYAPPEYYSGIDIHTHPIAQTWDLFSLAVIFYRLLFCIHPYTGSCKAPYDQCNDLADMVKNNLFPHGAKKSSFIAIPPPHRGFENVPASIKDMFLKAFNDPSIAGEIRPSAEEWCAVLNPEPVIKIHYQKPSEKFNTHQYEPSKPKRFNPNVKLTYPDILFTKNIRLGLFRKFLFSIVRPPLAFELKRKLIHAEKEFMARRNKQAQNEEKLKDIILNFNNHQLLILQKEKARSSHLEDISISELSKLDIQSTVYINEEKTERNKSIHTCKSEIANIESNQRTAYERLTGSLYLQKENMQRQYFLEKKKVNDDRLEYVENQKRNPQKLIRFNIRQHAHTIFTNYEITNINWLEQKGFRCAADISDIASDGYIKNRSNQWIKVPGIASVRGGQLLEWVNKLSLIEDNTIVETANKSFNQKTVTIESSKVLFDRSINSKIEEANRSFKNEKCRYESQIISTKKDLENRINAIKIKYSNLHDQLYKNVEVLQERLFKDRDKVQEETRLELDQNLDQFNKTFADSKKSINEEISTLEFDKNEILTLQFHFERSRKKN